jgi:hypothetical protein
MKESTKEKHRNQVLSEVTKGKIGQKSKKCWANSEYRIRMSGENCLLSGTKWMHNSKENARVVSSEVEKYISGGYVFGRLPF